MRATSMSGIPMTSLYLRMLSTGRGKMAVNQP
nr:MAG TPA: hypothetical protein [Caudoviricetes sp.]